MESTHIVITGARENNLADLTVRVPKHKITAFTGVSGSGKSSLVFDTIAAESGRQLNETFSAFARTFLPSYSRPDVDSIENLPAAIIVDQKRLGGNARSTVGTVTDIAPLLRLVFSRAGTPHVGYSNAFSFNDPAGMCPECHGLGNITKPDLDALLDTSRSLADGAIRHPQFKVGGWLWKLYAHSGLLDPDKPLTDYDTAEWETFLHGPSEETKVALDWNGSTVRSTFEGFVDKVTRLYINKDDGEGDGASARKQELLRRFTTTAACPGCEGARLRPEVLACRVNGHSIAELSAMEITALVDVVAGIAEPVVAPVVANLVERLRNLVDIGLGYLSLDRRTATLSGGESQRIKTVKHLSSALIDMLYVFDEPSVGLHPRDVHRLTELLVRLRDRGNTVLVVEHDPDVVAVADHVIDMGPDAGAGGGHVVYNGDVAGLTRAETLTGRYFSRGIRLKETVRTATGALPVVDANAHNLTGITVDVPSGVLTVVTGVAGSGKSTLVHDGFLPQHPEAVVIDQSAPGTSRRSNLATYTGLLDVVRSLFARECGVKASLFSFNSDGACPDCQGAGVIYTDLAFLEGLKSVCETCEGRRFSDAVLAHRLRGRSISDVLAMTAAEAAEFFTERKPKAILSSVLDVGLGYLTLGQPLGTLSGGECQRVKLATELHKQGSIYVLDEPTTGLHLRDVEVVLSVLDRLVDGGNTVLVVEHNLDVIGRADWVIDLGPEGGHEGGRVVFQGTPRELLDAPGSHTAEYLRRAVRPAVSAG